MKQKLALGALITSAALTMSGKIDINFMPQTNIYQTSDRGKQQVQTHKTLCDRKREFTDHGNHVCEYTCREGDQKTLYMTYYSNTIQCRDTVETEVKP